MKKFQKLFFFFSGVFLQLELEKQTHVLTQLPEFKLVLNISAFIASAMAEGTRYLNIDDAIKSLNKFKKKAKTQIRELNNTILRFMQAIDQRLEDRGEPVRCIEEPALNTFHNDNHQY